MAQIDFAEKLMAKEFFKKKQEFIEYIKRFCS
jgi:hypothetical protein